MISQTLLYLQGLVANLNLFVAGAVGGDKLIAGAITASILGSVVFALRKLPGLALRAIDKLLFFTYRLEYYSLLGNPDRHQPVLSTFGQKVASAIYAKIQRKQSWATIDIINASLIETVHPGRFSLWLGTIPVFGKFEVESGGKKENHGAIKNTIRLKTFKPFRPQLYKYIADMSPDMSQRSIFSISQYTNTIADVVRYRSLVNCPNIVLDEELKKDIDDAIEIYLKNREYNNQHHLPHKLTFMFYGEPGNGKSTLGEYIAWKLNSSLFVLQSVRGSGGECHSVLNSYMESIRANIPLGAVPVLLADDFDTCWEHIGPRDKGQLAPVVEGEIQGDVGRSTSLGNLLISLQSSIAINDAVVIFTTNHLEKIDPALYRPGRITLLREIKKMEPQAITQLFKDTYSKPWPTDAVCLKWRACDVSAFIEKSNGDGDKFISFATDSKTPLEVIEEIAS